MRKTAHSVFGPDHPAFNKVLQTPEVLLGVTGIVVILLIAFNVLFASVQASATQIDKDIATKEQELKDKEALDVLLMQLKSEADQNNTDLLTMGPGEIASVKIFNFLKELEALSADPLNLPEPHHQVSIFHVEQVLNAPSTAPAAGTPKTSPAQAVATQNLFSPEVAPFSVAELAPLNLNIPVELYTYKIDVRGSYLGLVNFLRKVAIHSPLVGIKGVELKVDPEAPSVLLFRNVPAPALASTTPKPSIPTTTGTTGAPASGAPSALPSELVKPFSLKASKQANTPLVMTLTVDIFLSTPTSPTEASSPATITPDANAGMPTPATPAG
jgi:hypothetical protein